MKTLEKLLKTLLLYENTTAGVFDHQISAWLGRYRKTSLKKPTFYFNVLPRLSLADKLLQTSKLTQENRIFLNHWEKVNTLLCSTFAFCGLALMTVKHRGTINASCVDRDIKNIGSILLSCVVRRFCKLQKNVQLTGLLAGLYILMAQFFDLAFFLVSDVLSRNLTWKSLEGGEGTRLTLWKVFWKRIWCFKSDHAELLVIALLFNPPLKVTNV